MRMAWKPRAEAWYVAPTYRQAKQIAWRRIKELAAPYTVGRPNESDLSIDLAWGTRLALRGGNNYDALRGPGLDGVIIDEAADVPPEAWFEVLRPMLADRKGSALIIGTPKGFNWFHDLWKKAAGLPDAAAFQFTTIQGGNVSAAEIEANRRELDEKTFRQEFEASFENLYVGQAYYTFDRERHLRPLEFVRGAPLCWSLDFNVDPMSSVIAQVIDTTTDAEARAGQSSRIIHVLDEIVLPDSRTAEAIAAFRRRIEGYFDRGLKAIWVFGDASGAGRSTQALKSDWQQVRDALREERRVPVSIRVPAANPAVRERVGAVCAALRSATGRVTLLIDPQCKELVRDLSEVVWARDGHGNALNELSKHDPKRTHVSDALGYLVWRLTKPVGGPRSEAIV